MSTTLRYNYRLRPGAVAEARLLDEWHTSRWIWNQCVAAQNERGRRWITDKDLTEIRARLPWVRAGSVVSQQQTLRTFAKSKGRKKFKAAHKTLPSVQYTRRGFSLKEDRKLHVAGGIAIPVVWSRELPSEPSSVRIYRDSLGHWYASFVVDVEDEAFPDAPDGAAPLGIDWGVTVTATTTDPAYDLPHSEFGKKNAAGLAKYQRRMARRKPKPGKTGSRGYKQAKRDTAKQYKKTMRQRSDTARKWARGTVVAHHQIAAEAFKPGFMAKSTLARKASDGAIGAAAHHLEEYAVRAGRELVKVPAPYTTMTCSSCLTRAKQKLPLSERVFLCWACGYTADRDWNAARVCLVLAGFVQADADAVRRAQHALRDVLACAS